MIPFNIPYVPEISKEYVLEALASNHQQGDGPFTMKASKMISDLTGGGHVLLTPSCTHALEMACMLANIAPGDEVIMPSYTFTSAAIAVTKFGGIPVFIDIDNRTKCIDAQKVQQAITSRTKAISWVNYAGFAPDIDALKKIAAENKLVLIEDNAHGLGGMYKGKKLGSFGDFATQSFHATKNIQCGEGGALVINNSSFIERAEIIREKGTNRASFIKGMVQKYQWVDKGSSYLLAEALAALLLGQLENFDLIQGRRNDTWRYYQKAITSSDQEIKVMQDPESLDSTNVAHIFFLETKNINLHAIFDDLVAEFGVPALRHYQPLHNSTAGRKLRPIDEIDFSNTVATSETLFRLPVYPGLSEQNLFQITQAVNKVVLMER